MFVPTSYLKVWFESGEDWEYASLLPDDYYDILDDYNNLPLDKFKERLYKGEYYNPEF